MILEVKNLTVEYPGVRALDDVSFGLRQKEVLALVGESASGKSTFAHSVLDILPSCAGRAGEIIFQGRDILCLSGQEMLHLRGSEIGLITQDAAASFNPVLTCGYHFHELLSHKLGIKNISRRREIMAYNLERVRLGPIERILRSYPHQLSGGQCQRLSIAMALSLNPKVLIADEPTSSLDVTAESRIVNLFKDLKRTFDLSLIFITHNLDLVKVLADRVVVLYKGKVCEEAPVSRLFEAPVDGYTRSLIDALGALE